MINIWNYKSHQKKRKNNKHNKKKEAIYYKIINLKIIYNLYHAFL